MEFDSLELVGIAASLVLALLVVRYALPEEEVHWAVRAAVLAAICFVSIGPFVRRRARRAARDEQ
jgi:hypothetical protein